MRLGELSNRAQILARNAAETAEADGKAIVANGLAEIFQPDPGGNVLAASNRPFVAEFLRIANDASLVNSEGVPTADAAGRIKRAMLAAVEECVRKNQRDYTRDNPGFFGQVSEDLVSSVRQRLERMMAGAGKERLEAINRVMLVLSEGSEKLAVTQAEYRRQFDAMLAWSVEGTGKSVRDLIRELEEPIPEDLNRRLVHLAAPVKLN